MKGDHKKFPRRTKVTEPAPKCSDEEDFETVAHDVAADDGTDQEIPDDVGDDDDDIDEL
jgi:hypothetical protein